jgi:hypothetical protein
MARLVEVTVTPRRAVTDLSTGFGPMMIRSAEEETLDIWHCVGFPTTKAAFSWLPFRQTGMSSFLGV